MPKHDALTEVQEIIKDVESRGRDGSDTDCVSIFEDIDRIVFTTDSAAKYLIELNRDGPSLVSVIPVEQTSAEEVEQTSALESVTFCREQCIPDKVFEIGKTATITCINPSEMPSDQISVHETGKVISIWVL